MKVMSAFLIVLGAVVLAGVVFSLLGWEDVLLGPDFDLRDSVRIFLVRDVFPLGHPEESTTEYVEFENVTYSIEISKTINRRTIELGVKNLQTGEISNGMLREGQTKYIGDLGFKVFHVSVRYIEGGFAYIETYVTGRRVESECVEPPRGLVSWWPGIKPTESPFAIAYDIADSNNGFRHGGLDYAPGKVGDAFLFDGVDDYIEVEDSDNLDVTSVTVDAWVKANDISNKEPKFIVNDGGYSIEVELDGRVECDLFLRSGRIISLGGNLSNLERDRWTHIACTYDEIFGVARLYKNGENIAEPENRYPGDPLMNHDYRPFFMGGAPDGNGYFDGLIDEIEIHNVALTEEEIRAIYDAGSYGKCREEPARHAICENDACVVVEGEGENECSIGTDCMHLECEANACVLVSGAGEDQCGPGKPPCGGEEWHYGCVGEQGCILVPGPGPDTCDPAGEECPKLGHQGGVR